MGGQWGAEGVAGGVQGRGYGLCCGCCADVALIECRCEGGLRAMVRPAPSSGERWRLSL